MVRKKKSQAKAFVVIRNKLAPKPSYFAISGI
jgi:hypothetical protein